MSITPLSAIQQLREMLSSMPATPAQQEPWERREKLDKLAQMIPTATDVTPTPAMIAGVPCEWVKVAASNPARAILLLHGGGFVAGSVQTHRAMAGELARYGECEVLVVDYRLAPEHPYPAALDDSMAVYQAVSGEGGRQWGLLGDSAGGGLALSLAVAARDKGMPPFKAIALYSAWADLSLEANSHAAKKATDPLVTTESLRCLTGDYIGSGDAKQPLVSPVNADLNSLPPMLLQVGSEEVLLDDTLAIDREARACGVDSTLEVWPEMVHDFQAFIGLLPEAEAALRRTGDFFKRRWS